MAVDAETGALLWKASLGGQIVMEPIHLPGGGQAGPSTIAGHTLVTFGLRD